MTPCFVEFLSMSYLLSPPTQTGYYWYPKNMSTQQELWCQSLTVVNCATKLMVLILDSYSTFLNSLSANADLGKGLVYQNNLFSPIECVYTYSWGTLNSLDLVEATINYVLCYLNALSCYFLSFRSEHSSQKFQ